MLASAAPRDPGGTGSAEVLEDPNGIWVHVDFPGTELPQRGWKLHVSATPWSAREVLDACVPMLLAHRTPFKVAATIERLIELNEGVGGVAQAGKFLTVYPADAEASVDLARRLDSATRGLRGPRVLNEQSLSPSSLVHYRFGDYVEEPTVLDGEIPQDPFVAAGLASSPATKLIGRRYLVTATLHRSVRGAIHLAVDAIDQRSCILKRAWRDAIATPDGRDARDRLHDEASLLKSIDDPHFPTVFDVLDEDDDLFVAMEYIEGPTFAELVGASRSDGTPPGEEQIVAWGRDLCAALSSLHTKGFVHRDLNPINVIAGERLVLIDLELAQRIGGETRSFGAGTPGYVSDNQKTGGAATVADDIFGVGALLFFAATGTDPDVSDNDARAVAQRAKAKGVVISHELSEVIARCMGGDRQWVDVDEIDAALSSLSSHGIP